MDVVWTKVLVAVLFGLLRLFFGLLPIKIYSCLKIWEKEDEGAPFINDKRHKQVSHLLALFQSFGGGVLFATCFLHMIPDVNKSVHALLVNNDMTSVYPFSQIIVSMGFFVVYFVEEISHWLITKMGKETRKKIKCKKAVEEVKHASPRSLSPKENKIHPEERQKDKQDAVYIIDAETNIEEKLPNGIDIEKENEKNLRLSQNNEAEHRMVIRENSTDDEEFSPKRNAFTEDYEGDETEEEAVVLEEVKQVQELEKLMERQEKDQQQILRCCLVILALSLHAVFEGLAIGLQASISNIWYLFTAVTIHSATILFCIGLELLIARTKLRIIIMNIVILSVTSPFGVLLGLLVTLHANMDTNAKSVAVVLLEGLSAGTILYITFFEVLNREKARRVIILTRAGFIICGFALMAILEYVEIDDKF